MADRLYVLTDHYYEWSNLRPLTLTRSIADLRIGITTIWEKWAYYLGKTPHIKTIAYLQPKYGDPKISGPTVFINSAVIPDVSLVEKIRALAAGESLYSQGILIASFVDKEHSTYEKEVTYEKPIDKITSVWDLFLLNDKMIEHDVQILTKNKPSQQISPTNQIVGDKARIFIDENAVVECAILNTTGGSIYIGKNAEVMEGAMIRGPFSLCESSVVKMGAKIYGPTSVGPHSKVGGEISHSSFLGYSNKAHDGFLGNSVIGEWCNLGADTNNSNLKNNYSVVSMWNYHTQEYVSSGLQFLGVIMGDHSKTGINTMLNSGTVIGVSANVFGSDFPKKYIPSFSWGGANGFSSYLFDKAIETAGKVMARRNQHLSPSEKDILQHIFNEENSTS